MNALDNPADSGSRQGTRFFLIQGLKPVPAPIEGRCRASLAHQDAMLAASNICKRLYSRPIHSPPCAVDHANRLTQIKPLLDLERFSTQLVLHSDFRPAMTAGALSSLTAFCGELPRETRPNGAGCMQRGSLLLRAECDVSVRYQSMPLKPVRNRTDFQPHREQSMDGRPEPR